MAILYYKTIQKASVLDALYIALDEAVTVLLWVFRLGLDARAEG
jgi:hypothetical protein